MCYACCGIQPPLHFTYTQKMQYELTCAECNISFSSAALMLKHFAQHAAETKESESQSSNTKKATIPDLYPISSFKAALKQTKLSKTVLTSEDNEENVDSGVEDVNPLRYCAVSIEDLPLVTPEAFPDDNTDNEYISFRSKCTSRKYKCTYCSKTFGWSTDLKRHILTHTGERPFKCSLCDSTFTRKFLLQKHQAKQHSDVGYGISSTMLNDKIKIPPLKPIGLMLKQKSRKQDKQKIKRKVFNAKNLYQSVNGHFEVADHLICST